MPGPNERRYSSSVRGTGGGVGPGADVVSVLRWARLLVQGPLTAALRHLM